jgi:hypothetical protein
MKEGYWINYRTDRVFPVDEHEQFIREPGNAKRLGVPDSVMRAAGKFEPVKDRDKFLLFLVQNAPVMRARGHGNYVSFEYASHSRQEPLDAIWIWGKENAGPFTQMNISNLATGENTQMYYQQFEQAMDEGGYDAVMRAASVQPVRRKIAAELLKLSKQILRQVMSIFL